MQHVATDNPDVHKGAYLLAGANQLDVPKTASIQPRGAGGAGEVDDGHLLDGVVGREHLLGLDLERVEMLQSVLHRSIFCLLELLNFSKLSNPLNNEE